MLSSRPLTVALALFTVVSFAFPLYKMYRKHKNKTKAAKAADTEVK